MAESGSLASRTDSRASGSGHVRGNRGGDFMCDFAPGYRRRPMKRSKQRAHAVSCCASRGGRAARLNLCRGSLEAEACNDATGGVQVGGRICQCLLALAELGLQGPVSTKIVSDLMVPHAIEHLNGEWLLLLLFCAPGKLSQRYSFLHSTSVLSYHLYCGARS